MPDVLDEARWELEWMQRMQVPAGEQYAGLVFHKVQDDGWTGLPLAPDEDPQTRQVHRPSTAATLNLAAVAAKGARLWEPYDEEFAASLLESARTAWAAAVETPDLYASALDGNDGGGPYDDKDVTDEFYWAAAELYLTTGDDEFADAVTGSPVHSADLEGAVAFDWQRTAALGRMDLALVPSELPDRDAVRDSVVTLADFALYQQGKAFFGQPYQPSDARFEWGSNGIILNNAVTLAAAARDHGRRGVPHGRAGEPRLRAGPQRARPVLRDRLRHPVLPEPAPPDVRRAAGPDAPAPAGRHPVRRSQQLDPGPRRRADLAAGVRRAAVLPRQHPVLVHQRDDGQLELVADVDGGVGVLRRGRRER